MWKSKYSKPIHDYKKSIKLDINEYEYPHPPEFYNYMISCIHSPKMITHYSNHYYDTTISLLTNISNYLNNYRHNDITNENILLCAGSNSSLEYIKDNFIDKDTSVIILEPTYSYFETISETRTEHIHKIDYIIDYSFNVLRIPDLPIININNTIVYIVNPNNPTGLTIPKDEIELKLIQFPDTIFIIDEAYIDFVPNLSCIDFINYPNCIITRTFSKAFGIAGLRLGYIVSNKVNIKLLYKNYKETAVSEIAKCAGNFILQNIEYYKDNMIKIVKENLQFQKFLDVKGIKYLHSSVSFLMIYVKDPLKIEKLLEDKNIHIRVKMPKSIRISIGTHEQMDLLTQCIDDNLNLFL